MPIKETKDKVLEINSTLVGALIRGVSLFDLRAKPWLKRKRNRLRKVLYANSVYLEGDRREYFHHHLPTDTGREFQIALRIERAPPGA